MQKLLTFFQQKISAYLHVIDVNFNESLTNDVISFEQLSPENYQYFWIEKCSLSRAIDIYSSYLCRKIYFVVLI